MELCAAIVLLAIVGLIWLVSSFNRRRLKTEYEEQERLFEEWARERFPLSEVDTENRLRKGNSIETARGSRWAEEMIESDRKSWWQGITPFEKWGKEKFDSSWLETRERLCRLVSANRTP